MNNVQRPSFYISESRDSIRLYFRQPDWVWSVESDGLEILEVENLAFCILLKYATQAQVQV
jgi:hypothetical protein